MDEQWVTDTLSWLEEYVINDQPDLYFQIPPRRMKRRRVHALFKLLSHVMNVSVLYRRFLRHVPDSPIARGAWTTTTTTTTTHH